LIGAATSVASAQPVLTVLTGANSVPTGVCHPQANVYVVSAGNGRWTVSGGSTTFATNGSLGGGLISADGAFQTTMIQNNGFLTGQTNSTISPAWAIPSSTTTTALPANDTIAARFTASTFVNAALPGIPASHTPPAGGAADFQCYGPGDDFGIGVSAPTGMSQNGRFVGIQSTISTYNASGTAIVSSTSRFRPALWDANTNTTRLLPTPYRTTSQTQRRRDGTVFGVSNDGLVIVGAQENNVGAVSTGPDPDGGRLVVWRWNGSDYSMSYLPNAVNGSGYPVTYSISPGKVVMNSTGTIIIGPAFSNAGVSFVGKWVWNGSSWNQPINLGSMVNMTVPIINIDDTGGVITAYTSAPHGLNANDWVAISGNSVGAYTGFFQVLSAEAPNSFTFNALDAGAGTGGVANKAPSWLPDYILGTPSCPGVLPSFQATGLTDDGNTIVGLASYSPNPCDSTHAVAQAGWIWTTGTGYMEDWYDHLKGLGVAGLGQGDPFGPPVFNSPPLLAGPRAMSPDATAFIGAFTLTVGGKPWILTPPIPVCGSADFDCDGDIGTDADIEAFFACIAGRCPPPPCTSNADFNGDGDIATDADIEAFFRVLAGNPC
jgi:hypothetical protein